MERNLYEDVGDEMNLELLLDKREYEEFSRLAPHTNVADTHKPFTISKSVALPKPLIATMANWMHGNAIANWMHGNT